MNPRSLTLEGKPSGAFNASQIQVSCFSSQPTTPLPRTPQALEGMETHWRVIQSIRPDGMVWQNFQCDSLHLNESVATLVHALAKDSEPSPKDSPPIQPVSHHSIRYCHPWESIPSCFLHTQLLVSTILFHLGCHSICHFVR